MANHPIPPPAAFFGARLSPASWLAKVRLSGCDRVGPGTRTLGRPLIHNDGKIEIGSGVTLRSLGSPVRLTTSASATLAIGNDVTIDVGARIFAGSSVVIEDGVAIGPNAIICDRDENGSSGPIVIERGARIGAGASIIGPSRVGRDATVFAGAVVRGDVAPAASVPYPGATRREIPVAPQKGSHPVGSNGSNGVSHGAATAVDAAVRSVSALLLADFTIDELAEHLAGPEHDGLAVRAEIAPFDQVVPTLMDLGRRETKPDLALVWTRPGQVSPAFREVLLGGAADVDAIMADVDAFAATLKASRGGARFVFVPSWVLPPTRRGLGMLELRGSQGTGLLMRMNLRLADALAESPNVFVLDVQRWMAAAGDGGFDPKLWHAGKVAFTSDVFREAAMDVLAGLRGVLGLSRKLVVVDLDDTLWGGVVGDVGWEGLRLGGHDYAGEAFVQFQRQLLALTKRGIALAVVSKNEEATALEAMRMHPEMLIKPEALAAYRINWRDKAQNILEITQELNLGLQSTVFIDDNPIERGRVHEALPEVYVPDWPIDPTRYGTALDSLRCFDSPHVSAEDRERNAMYATERERTSLRSQVASFDEWLATLGLKTRFERLGPGNVARAAQLLNKTNQMNLRTRRLSESEFLQWSRVGGRETWTVHVSDRFGDAGLTGLLSLAREGDDVQVADYVLSCRVMGRRVEETMLWAARRRAAALGGRRLVVSPLSTAKNKPCLDFMARAGMPQSASDYVPLAVADEPSPALVAVEGLE
jgi:FkbH-like protein